MWPSPEFFDSPLCLDGVKRLANIFRDLLSKFRNLETLTMGEFDIDYYRINLGDVEKPSGVITFGEVIQSTFEDNETDLYERTRSWIEMLLTLAPLSQSGHSLDFKLVLRGVLTLD